MSAGYRSGLTIYATQSQGRLLSYYSCVQKADVFNYGRFFGTLLELLALQPLVGQVHMIPPNGERVQGSLRKPIAREP